MRIQAFTLKPLLLASCALMSTWLLCGAELKIRYMDPQAIEEQNFKRISEYFSYEENPGNRVIMRTNPEERAGMYFVITLNDFAHRIPEGSKIVLEYYHADSLKPFKYAFDFPYEMAKKTLALDLFVGVTGDDWQGGAPTQLVAWHAQIEDASGGLLAEYGSYLWEQDNP